MYLYLYVVYVSVFVFVCVCVLVCACAWVFFPPGFLWEGQVNDVSVKCSLTSLAEARDGAVDKASEPNNNQWETRFKRVFITLSDHAC